MAAALAISTARRGAAAGAAAIAAAAAVASRSARERAVRCSPGTSPKRCSASAAVATSTSSAALARPRRRWPGRELAGAVVAVGASWSSPATSPRRTGSSLPRAAPTSTRARRPWSARAPYWRSWRSTAGDPAQRRPRRPRPGWRGKRLAGRGGGSAGRGPPRRWRQPRLAAHQLGGRHDLGTRRQVVGHQERAGRGGCELDLVGNLGPARWRRRWSLDLLRTAGGGDSTRRHDVAHQELALEPHGVTCSVAVAVAVAAPTTSKPSWTCRGPRPGPGLGSGTRRRSRRR